MRDESRRDRFIAVTEQLIEYHQKQADLLRTQLIMLRANDHYDDLARNYYPMIEAEQSIVNEFRSKISS